MSVNWCFLLPEYLQRRSYRLLNLSLCYIYFHLLLLCLLLLFWEFIWSWRVFYYQCFIAADGLEIWSLLDWDLLFYQLHQFVALHWFLLELAFGLRRLLLLTFVGLNPDGGQFDPVLVFLKSRQVVPNNGTSLEIIEPVPLSGFGHAVDLPGYLHLVVLVDTDQHYHYYNITIQPLYSAVTKQPI